jgi:hypothetical protein
MHLKKKKDKKYSLQTAKPAGQAARAFASGHAQCE